MLLVECKNIALIFNEYVNVNSYLYYDCFLVSYCIIIKQILLVSIYGMLLAERNHGLGNMEQLMTELIQISP